MDCKIKIDDLITHTLPLAYLNNGFALMHSDESMRRVVALWLTRAMRDARRGRIKRNKFSEATPNVCIG